MRINLKREGAVMNKITWQKWEDPLKTLISKKVSLLDDDDDDDDSGNIRFKNNNIGPVIVGSLGVIPISEDDLISNKRSFWEAHTNFDITFKTVKLIESTPGVEILRLLTRYTFIISAGKMFTDDEVKTAVEAALGVNSRAVSCGIDRVSIMKKQAAKKFKNWAIFVMPNGRIEYDGAELRKDVFDKINQYKKVEGTKIYTSWE